MVNGRCSICMLEFASIDLDVVGKVNFPEVGRKSVTGRAMYSY